MRIVINHVTRMEKGYVCVAGICAATASHIRPVLPGERLPASLAEAHGGPFAVRNVVELGEVRPCGEQPLVEDVEFEPSQTRKLGRGNRQAFWNLLNGIARRRLADLFGKELVRAGTGMATPVGAGTASLGCLVPAEPPELRVNEFGRIRIAVEDTDSDYTLSVTDLRLHHPEDNSVNQEAVRELNRKLRSGQPCVLSLGLTRPWTKPGDSQSRHWLQVNGIHLEAD